MNEGPLDAEIVPEPAANARPLTSSMRQIVNNPWLVLGLLFFVMAALGLPILWMSRGFSRLSKLVLTVVVLLYTAALFYAVWLVLLWSYHRVVDAL
jgi:hypothetical protein